jgi:hypothetical protein
MAAHVALKSEAQEGLVRAVVDATADMRATELESPHWLRVVLERLADKVLPTSDPLRMAKLRGLVARRELLSADGGALTASDVTKLLDISRQAVDKRRKAGQLLAVELPKRGLLYPAWQFSETGALLPGLVVVLAALREHDPWAQARFFVTSSDRLNDKRPLDLLRDGDVAPVLAAARSFGEHGAA